MFFLPFVSNASDDCLAYKLHPNVNIITPVWTKQVVQPLREMDLLHGNVIATMTDNYEIIADITQIEDGYCVSLKSVDASVGYSDFLVQIDIRHIPDTCSYNAILTHEDEHIRAYMSIMDEFNNDLKKSIQIASDSITPIFVRDATDIDTAVDKMNEDLRSHPDLILIMQKIKAVEEIRNRRVDINDTGAALKRCIL